MICFLVQRLIHAYLGDALPPKDADRLRHHCQECTACGTALREAQAAARLVSLLPRWSLPEGEGEALLGRVRARGQARLGEQILGTGVPLALPRKQLAARAGEQWDALKHGAALAGFRFFSRRAALPACAAVPVAAVLLVLLHRGTPTPQTATQLGQVVEAPPVAGGELAPPPTSDHRGPIRPPAHRDAARPMAAPNIASAPVPSRAPDRPPAAGSTVAPRPRTARPAQRPAQRAACGEQPASTPPVTVIQMPAAKRGQRLAVAPPRTAADSGAPPDAVGRAAAAPQPEGEAPTADILLKTTPSAPRATPPTGGAPPGVAEGALRAAPNEETMAAQPPNALQETMGARGTTPPPTPRAGSPTISRATAPPSPILDRDPAGPTAKREAFGPAGPAAAMTRAAPPEAAPDSQGIPNSAAPAPPIGAKQAPPPSAGTPTGPTPEAAASALTQPPAAGAAASSARSAEPAGRFAGRPLEELTRLLAGKTEDARDAARELGRVKEKRAVQALAKALRTHADPSVREATAEALAAIATPEAIRALRAAAASDTPAKEPARRALERMVRSRSSQGGTPSP